MKVGIYLHIPFCVSKCWYCDFFSVVGKEEAIPDYVDAVCQEMYLYAGQGLMADTVYFGGGTPSLLSPGQLGRILDSLRSGFRLTEDAEVSCETNPETVDRSKLAEFRHIGINRLSLGVQSFHDDEHRQMERAHDTERAIRCIEDARSVGFDNLSLDLISALPGMSLASWSDNLQQTVRFSPEHVSAYTLEYHEGARLTRERDASKVKPLDEAAEGQMFLETIRFLGQHGYEHYEVSNFARAGYRCRHNVKYWNQKPYVGLGASAHGFLGRRRYWNHSDLEHYLRDVSEGRKPVEGAEELDDGQLALERLLLGLRTAEGADWEGPLPRGVPDDLVVRRGNRLALTPEGFALYDSIGEAFAQALG
jgi:oxygen-independent coproporphyrinogen-3 oxidase